MWTYSGMFIEKRDGRIKVYTDSKEEINIFTEDNGELRKCFLEDIKKKVNKEGLYQAWTGYGPVGSMQEPGIYDVKWLCEINWDGK